MTVDNFTRTRSPDWIELQRLLTRAGGRPDKLGAADARRLGALYRAVSADLALARRRYPGEPVIGQLDRLVNDARVAVYERARTRDAFVRFVTTGYWQRVRERPRLLAAAAIVLFGFWGLCMLWAIADPGQAARFVPGTRGWGAPQIEGGAERAGAATIIFSNNIRVALMAFVGGITAGLGTVALLAYNGIALGLTSGLAITDGTGGDLLEWIPAHGILELSCIVVAGAAGLRLGGAILAPGERSRSRALAEEGRAAVELVIGTAMALVVAGLIEGFVSPAWLGLPAVMAIGLAVGGVFWALVVVRGRPEPIEPDGAASPEPVARFS